MLRSRVLRVLNREVCILAVEGAGRSVWVEKVGEGGGGGGARGWRLIVKGFGGE